MLGPKKSYMHQLASSATQMLHYYMPYFTGWFLDIKISKEYSYEYVPRGLSLKRESYFNFNFHGRTLNTSQV
jgi:hypothetical protein